MKVYVSAAPANLKGEVSDIEFTVTNKTDKESASYSAKFNGPAEGAQ